MRRLAQAAYALDVQAFVTTSSYSRLTATVIAVTPVDLRLTMDANPDPGQRVTVAIPVSGTGKETIVTGVVHWSELRGSNHEVGVFLIGDLPRELRHLHRDARRQSERYRCRVSGRIDWGRALPETNGVVVNYSFDGMAVQSSGAGAIDEVFTFRWNDGKCVKSVTGAALWQIEQNGGFLIGCQLPNGGGVQLSGLSAEQLT